MAGEQSFDLMLSGKVVGVGLRIWVRALAGRLGVTGWIRNNVDRTVSIHVEGEEQTVQNFIEQLHRPNIETAVVDGVDVRDAERHGYSEFSIEY